jgi:hypothetical protein
MRKAMLAVLVVFGLGVAALAGFGGFTLAADRMESDGWSAEECADKRLTLAFDQERGKCRDGRAACLIDQAEINANCGAAPGPLFWTQTECQEARELMGNLRADPPSRVDLQIAINDNCP